MFTHEACLLVAPSTIHPRPVVHGLPLWLHVPAQPEVAHIPDDGGLWDRIWTLRDSLLGIAHSHPPGALSPSSLDLRTARAIERALGRTLRWWITVPDLRTVEWAPDRNPQAQANSWSETPLPLPPVWALLLVAHSTELR